MEAVLAWKLEWKQLRSSYFYEEFGKNYQEKKLSEFLELSSFRRVSVYKENDRLSKPVRNS